VVADVIGDPHPEIFFIDISSRLTALQLVSGQLTLLWQFPPGKSSYGHLAVARVPNSGLWIICALEDSTNIFCADASNGVILFSQQPLVVDLSTISSEWKYSAIAIERLFQSDTDNIFILAPSRVFKYNPISGVSVYCNIPYSGYMEIPFAVDIHQDGIAELFYSNCVYSAVDCSVIWCDTKFLTSPHGITSAVANMDGDPQGEVVMCGNGRLSVSEHDGTLKWFENLTPSSPTPSEGAPTIADFNGDGIPDVGVQSHGNTYFLLDGASGNQITSVFPMDNSGFASSSSFDFQDDGSYELISSSSTDLAVSSTSWINSVPRNSAVGSSYPVITDLDLDGVADILTVGDYLSVISPSDPWMGSGYFWNQNGFNGMNHDSQFYPQVTQVSKTFRSTTPSRFVNQKT